jgi:D-beta-D-heptose 7-phosphate kinase/D-beta-D-heptose 1-phosphate adenosyltransferase
VSRLVVVGDALLDRDVEGASDRLCPDAPVPVLDEAESRVRPGGAGLAAALAAREGRSVTLIAALAPDAAGAELARALLAAGVDLLELRLTGATPEKVRFLDRGRPLMRLDRGGPAPSEDGRGDGENGLGEVRVDGAIAALRAALAGAGAILVSDYGRGVAAAPEVRQALAERPAGVPLVWDPHPRGPAPIPGADLVTPNLAEADELAGSAPGPAPGPPGDGTPTPEALARALARRWRAGAVCVTRGERGVTLAGAAGRALSWRTRPVAGDPCGAGDCFAAASAWTLADGAAPAQAARAAVRAAAAYVAESGARTVSIAAGSRSGTPAPSRGPGRTVVATGGCFDLLHLGHVRTLEAARAFGDRLVVLLNSDRSVRGLKGGDRPLVGERERAETLRALACVDEVRIFDEPDPTQALTLLRPQIWVKGGDYQADELAEAEAIATWGGRIAILPYLEGRSTTRLIEEASERVGS